MKKRVVLYVLIGLLVLIFFLFLIRGFSLKHLDDISPEIYCEENILRESDVYFVIPKFNNKSISDNPKWCEEIKNSGKILGLHGVYHTYEEFNIDRSEEYLQEGIDIFEKCFGYKPSLFKPPQLKITKENKKIMKSFGMIVYTPLKNVFHKAYHCSDTGLLPNWFHRFF
jgi:predicted deacetylase